MSEVLNLTEILTEVQNFITADGQIVPAQRNFYQNLRVKMNNHTGLFNEAEFGPLLLETRLEVLELTDEDYTAIYNIIMDRFGLSKRLEEEDQLRQELAIKVKLRKEAEQKAKAEAITKQKAENEAKAKAEAELKAQIEVEERLMAEAQEKILAEENARKEDEDCDATSTCERLGADSAGTCKQDAMSSE